MTAEHTRKLTEKYSLSYPALSDPGNQVASRFNLTHTLPQALQQVYSGFGIDLPKVNGDESWILPMPARYVINRQGIIVSADVSIDHTVRSEPEATLQALAAL